MENQTKTVKIYSRKIDGGKMKSLFLRYYPCYRDPETMKCRVSDSLGIYIYAKPENKTQRDHNERMLKVAEVARCRRYDEIVNERFGIIDQRKQNGDFIAYLQKLADKKNEKWQNVLKHFKVFCDGKCTFGEVTVDLCRKFMEYLDTEARNLKYPDHELHPNTRANYWSTFRHMLHVAARERKITENPNGFLDRIETIPTKREHLSLPELQKLADTPCDESALKRAFLFSCLTGLRKSDIKNLEWSNIQQYDNGVMYVTTRMQKTNEFVNNPISDEAYELLGEPGEGKIFADFKDKMLQAPLRKWLKAAGITKHISFHCARHTYGCLQLNNVTPLHVVQHMLGHKNITTTEVYAKMNDEQKMQTVSRITLKHD
jgi:integrase